jgi:DNA modification methylase
MDPTRINGRLCCEKEKLSREIPTRQLVRHISYFATFTALCARTHNAVFPADLVRPCILAGCPKGGAVLDPFSGSGTVSEVATELGRDAILVELNPVYVAMQQARTGVRTVIEPTAPASKAEERGNPGWLF